jgi:SM-20-related protein
MTSAGWPLPAIAKITDFLDTERHAELVAWTLANEARFKPAQVIAHGTGDNIVDPDLRVALVCTDFTPMRPAIRDAFLKALPTLQEQTGVHGEDFSLEIEIAAHGDGAFYGPHLDFFTDKNRNSVGAKPGAVRALSSVYYYYSDPKGFAGGNLRLFRFGPADHADGRENHIDVEPQQNSVVAFPSFVTHEVRPISCPSRAFRDYRFSVNCWFWRKI